MKKTLTLLALTIAILSCKKDDPEKAYIKAPILPTQSLYWGMSISDAIDEMSKAGYLTTTYQGKKYFNNNSTDIFWSFEGSSSLQSLIYYYNGGNLQWERLYWAGQISEEIRERYRLGIISWKTVKQNEIVTSTSVLTIEDGEKPIFTINNTTITPTLWVVYRPK